MRTQKFSNGDQVICKESSEIQQPMEIVGRNLWITDSDIIVYLVKGKHIKKGNELVINLSEEILEGV